MKIAEESYPQVLSFSLTPVEQFSKIALHSTVKQQRIVKYNKSTNQSDPP